MTPPAVHPSGMHPAHAGGAWPDLPDTTAIVAAISAPRQAIERAFVAMGDGLLSGERLLKDIAQTHQSMAAEFNGEDFLAAVQRIEAMRGEVDVIVSGISTGDGELARIDSTIRQLGGPLTEADTAIRLLGLVAFNARIVAATIQTDRADLAAFTNEMMEIANQANHTVRQIADVYQNVRTIFSMTRRTQAEFSRNHCRMMADIAADLDDALCMIARQREQAAEHARRSATFATDIGTRIGDAFAAMQIGDMTRQRLEHVERIVTLIGDRSGDWKPETTVVVRQLATAQIMATREDFSEDLAEFIRAITALRADAEKVLQDGTAQAGDTIASSSATLAALSVSLRALGPLLHEEAENRQNERRLSESATDAIEKLLGQLSLLERTEHLVRLLGLNMAIRCAKLGTEARAMRVVAREISVLANATSASATQVRSLISGAQTAIEEARRRSAINEDRVLTAEPVAAAQKMERVLDRLRGNVRMLGCACPDAAARLTQTADLARQVARTGVETASTVTQLHPGDAQPDMSNVDHAVLAELRAIYTMQSERVIHDRTCGDADDQRGAQDASVVSDDCLF